MDLGYMRRLSMKNSVKMALLAALVSGFFFSSPAVMAAGDGAAAKPAPAVMASGEKASASDTKKTEEKKEEKVEKEPLLSIDASALRDSDFSAAGIGLGDSLAKAEKVLGKPTGTAHSNTMDTASWKGISASGYISLLLPYSHRKDLPRDFDLPGKGITEILVDGESITTPRNIHVGSSRENVLRRYGRPSEVLWDGGNKKFFLLYREGKNELNFAIANDKVSTIRMTRKAEAAKEGPKSYNDVAGKDFLPDRDFRIAGYDLGQTFKDHSFEEWEKKMANPKEEIWYYSGYGVRLTAKSHLISALFLTDSRMVSPRGLAMGDDVSTVDLLYGKPHRIEMDVSGSEPKTSYIYFSKGKSDVLIINFEKNKVEGFVSTANPMKR